MPISKSKSTKIQTQHQASPTPSLRLLYIIERFPSPTEYFILNEIQELNKNGHRIFIAALRKQKQYLHLLQACNMNENIIWLPKIYFYLPFPSVSVLYFLIHSISDARGLISFLKKIRNCWIGSYFAKQLKHIGTRHIHAHFAFIAVDIARILSMALKVKFSFTAHAQDIFSGKQRIVQAVSNAAFTVTCTKYNLIHLKNITGSKHSKTKMYNVYHGIDISKWCPNGTKRGVDNRMIHILSIARLVEKKGLIYLLMAVNLLIGRGHNVKCTIIGEGALIRQLKKYIDEHMLCEHIHILNFIPQAELKKYYAGSDIFVLPCIVAKDGDRDGLPNVILESMAMGIPVITTPVSAIPEIIVHKQTGYLVGEKDAKGIASAILELCNNMDLYNKISDNSRKRILDGFNMKDCTKNLIDIFNTHILSRD